MVALHGHDLSLVSGLALTMLSIASTHIDSDIRAIRTANGATATLRKLKILATEDNIFKPIDPRAVKLRTAIYNLLMLCFDDRHDILLHTTSEAEAPEPTPFSAKTPFFASSTASSVSTNEKLLTAPLNLNNLIDSLSNIIQNPHAGLLVLTPGSDETVRVDGVAELRTDEAILDRWNGLFRRPKLAVVLTVDSVFIHCAKAFRRSCLWDPTTWTADAPDAAALLDEHLGGGLDLGAVRTSLDESYEVDLAEEQP